MTKKKTPDTTAKKVKVAETVYKVAPGKALTSKKGILKPGTVVKSEYFGGGQSTLDANVGNGSVVES